METLWVVIIKLALLRTVTVTASLVNVALRKPASMSSSKLGFSASTAVDGRYSPYIDTGTRYDFAWWKVDLEREVHDAAVKIYFRTDYKKRRNGVKLYTSTSSFSDSTTSQDQLCHIVTGDPSGTDIPDVYDVTCPGRWRYLLLYTDTDNDGFGPNLDFGEVEVLVCSDGTYGEDCTKTCSSRKCVTMTTTCGRDGRCPDGCQSGWTEGHCTQALPPCTDNNNYGLNCTKLCSNRKCKAPSTSSCDRLTGRCPNGCEAGWRQEDCTRECESGSYGPSCALHCNNRQCLDGSSCDHVTGQCVGGCQPGYKELDCTQECESGSYGPSCALHCNNRQCLDGSSCDHVTGQCVGGCQPGYKELDCTQECESGSYGPSCALHCNNRQCLDGSSCDHVTGQCVGGCQPGYKELDCTQECESGSYGPSCALHCNNRQCLDGSSCDHVTGQCVGGCQPGYKELDCTQECESGSYGPSCALHCNNRQCLDGSSCDHVTGQCVGGCQPGYKELDCTQALPSCTDNNNYGLNCTKLCSNRKCKAPPTSSCDRLTGRCPDGCEDGWRQEDCTQECESDSYGPSCELRCNNRHCLDGSSCDHVTGQCVGGCQPGYKELDCTQACDDGSYGPGCNLSCIDRKCQEPSTECNHMTGQCRNGCLSGFKGIDCIEKCDSGSYGDVCSLYCTDRKCYVSSSECDHVTGQCEGRCQTGYNGTDCRQACNQSVNYGVNCIKLCSDRQCINSSSVCDTKTGQCSGECQVGWRGDDCTSQCPAETFGSECTPCSKRHCQGKSDCPADGTCSQGCQDGFTGQTCTQECSPGLYGSSCSMTCGNCSSDDACHHVTGNCPSGCKAGWGTQKCNEERSTVEPTDIVIPVAAGAAAAVVVIIIVIVAVVICRRKRSKRYQSDDTPEHHSIVDSSRKRKTVSPENVYCNIAMDAVDLIKGEKTAKVAQQPALPPKPSRDEDDDQSEEIIVEDEAPSSKPYYNIDDEEVIREVAVEDLEATVQKIKRREGGFEAGYNRLPTGFTATYADSQKEENAGKNKFQGYYPYDHNRVRLSLLNDVPGSDYINASIMHNINETKTYIGAQAPKKITLGDFWRMIWEQRVRRVVMLTGLVEDMKVKCYQYWPENALLTTDHFRVTLEDTDTRANYTVRTMKVQRIETGESRRVVQYHYTTWPDHGVPDTLALVHFIWMMRRTHTRTDGPLLVHCSAGIGRTGTYIAVDSLLDQAREEGKVDVQGYVSIMRGQRKNMIQTVHQYECVFNCLVEMTKYGNTSLTVDDFTTLYTNSGMDAQVDTDSKTFRELTQMMLAEHNAGAPVKNRMWVDGKQEFIVRTAPSLRSWRGNLLCESPNPGQEKLLWKLVEENNVNYIIVLDKTQNKLVGEKGCMKTIDEMKLTTKDQFILTSDLSLSMLQIQIPIHQSQKDLKLLQFHEPVSVQSLSASFLEHSLLKLMTSELSPRAVVYSSTDRKTGVMFCMLGNLMSEIQEDETVDVLHQVRSFTSSFPDIKLTQDDVKQLFDFARRCAQLTANTYANM